MLRVIADAIKVNATVSMVVRQYINLSQAMNLERIVSRNRRIVNIGFGTD
jgi:hypothetical protein